MHNFLFYNPVKVFFGEHAVSNLGTLLSQKKHVLITAGGGSIKKNGCYDEVLAILRDQKIKYTEFWGIEANPDYSTLMKAVSLCKNTGVDFILALGGGSVLDGTKFIAAAACCPNGFDPWQLLCGQQPAAALPVGSVLTLPATGSESNCFSVISHREINQKRAFASPLVFPEFTILDPRYVLTLPSRQVTNGIVDPFVHVMEQYCTTDVDTPLQDRFSESILKTLVELGPRCVQDSQNIALRGNLMWCATQALNGSLACGVVQDWSTHAIGHELTALYGLDHAQTLAIVLPAVLYQQRQTKAAKLRRYAHQVWGLSEDDPQCIEKSIIETENFFQKVGAQTRLSDYSISRSDIPRIAAKVIETNGGRSLGEHADLGLAEIVTLLERAWPSR